MKLVVKNLMFVGLAQAVPVSRHNVHRIFVRRPCGNGLKYFLWFGT